MIHLVPAGEKRNFSPEEIQELLPALQRITARFSEKARAYSAEFGSMSEQDPEREVLLFRLRSTIQEWADVVGKLGVEPGALWSIHFPGEDGGQEWQLPLDGSG